MKLKNQIQTSCLLLLALLLSAGSAWPLRAADITPGYTFSAGEQNITHTKLNNATAGTVNSTFFTGKNAKTTLASTDLFLIYDPSAAAFRKVTLASLLNSAASTSGASVTNLNLFGTTTANGPILATNSIYLLGSASTDGTLFLTNSASIADEKIWSVKSDLNTFSINAVNDAGGSVYNPFALVRTGYRVYSVSLNATNVISLNAPKVWATGGLLVTGGITNSAMTANTIPYFDANKKMSNLTIGSGLSLSGGTLSATATGDVVGPASSTDNAIARFDSTTGKLLQNSGATISDAGKIYTPSLSMAAPSQGDVDTAYVLLTGPTSGVGDVKGIYSVKYAYAPGVDDDASSGFGVGSRWINTTDDKEYVCTDSTNGAAVWKETTASSGSGTGDVVGPASATDNALARFDSTTGKLIQNSGIIVDDGNNVSGVANLAVTTAITNSSLTASRVVYTDANKALASASFGPSDIVLSITNAGNSSFSLINSSNAPIVATKSLSAGSNITLTDQGTNIVVAASGGGGGGALGSGSIVTQSVVVITNQYLTSGNVLGTTTNAAVGDGFPVITNSFKPMYSTNKLRFVFQSIFSRSAIGTPGAIVADGYTNYWQGQIATIHANAYVVPATIIVENVPILQTTTNQEFTVRFWQDAAGNLGIGRSAIAANAFQQTSFRVEEYIP